MPERITLVWSAPRALSARRVGSFRFARGLLSAVCALVVLVGAGVAPARAAAGSWSSRSLSDGQARDANPVFTAVTCVAVSFCVAVDRAGSVVTSTNPTGGARAWTVTPVDLATYGCPEVQATCKAVLDAVSCPSVSLCVGVDDVGNVITSQNPTGGAGAWTFSHVDSFQPGCVHCGQASFEAISCPSVSLCVAGANGGLAFTSSNPTGGAGAWSSTSLGPPMGFFDSFPTGVSCPSLSLCVVVDAGGTATTSTNPTGGAGAWHAATVDYFTNSEGLTSAGYLGGVSCPSVSLCVAVEGVADGSIGGHVVTSTNPTGGAGAWTETYVDSARLTPCDSGACQASFHAISCPSQSLCVGVDDAGNAVTSTSPTGGARAWTVKHVDSSALASLGQGLSGVSCPSVSLCVAVDVSGNVLTSHNPTGGAESWTTAQLGVPSDAQVRALLVKELVPRGKPAKITALLKDDGYVLSFRSLSAGRVTIGWYFVPRGAHLTIGKTKPVLVATGHLSFSTARMAKIKIRLTLDGRKLLKLVKHLKLTAKGTFTPQGKPALTATRTFTLRR